jgi:hypothetical protein
VKDEDGGSKKRELPRLNFELRTEDEEEKHGTQSLNRLLGRSRISLVAK